MARMYWKKKKLLTVLANRRQWQREFDPTVTTGIEILMEHIAGSYLVIESSVDYAPTYIITE